ncbi:MAG TPA: hypothetical protein VE442_05420 [Jatrophihabitans sp.]|nr:hypothetical protein [Jatrophihabitans sp.]
MLILLLCVLVFVLVGVALLVAMPFRDDPFLGVLGLVVMLVAAVLSAIYAAGDAEL